MIGRTQPSIFSAFPCGGNMAALQLKPNSSSLLIIEPNTDVQMALVDFLEAEGFEISFVGTGAEAVTALESGKTFTVVILDLALPDMDGMNLLKVIGRFDPHLPVIVITGITELDRELRAFEHGALAFIRKPYNREEVLALLSRAVEVRKMSKKMHRMEEALQTSETRFQLIIKSAKDAIVLSNEQGTIIGWNEAAERLFGYPVDEMIGRPLTVLMPVRYQAAHQEGLENFRKTGKGKLIGKTLEVQGRHKDGTEIPIELTLSTWTQGEKNFFCGIIHDLSVRLQWERDLREREDLSNLKFQISQILVEASSLSEMLQRCAEALVTQLHGALARIWVLNPQSQILQLHASAGMYTHLDGKHASISMGQYKIGRIAQARKPHLTNQVQGDPEIHDQEWARREGMVAFAGYPIIIQDQLMGVLGMFAKQTLTQESLQAMANIANGIGLAISQRKHEEQIQHYQEIQHMILQSTQDGMYGLDLEGKTTFVNRMAEEWLGWESEELIGRSHHALIHHTKSDGSHFPLEECPIYAVLQDGKVCQVADGVFWRKDGTSFSVDYTSSPLRADDGAVVGVVVVFRESCKDETRKKKQKG